MTLISDLDASLQAMLTGEATTGSSLATAGISFAAPDETWQGQGSGMQVDVYLYRILDNRELRSNQRTTVMNADGTVTTQLFPSRIECSYIITAWEKGSDVAGMDKEPAEHALLSQILYVLWRNPTMPAKYLTGTLVNSTLMLPVIAAETEDMSAKPDFWVALDTYVRPAITCRVTIEMDLNQDVVGSQATTFLTTLDKAGGSAGDLAVMIGGVIRDAAVPTQTIAGAWIMLDASPLTYISSADGAFIIGNIAEGPHSLTVRAVGYAEGTRSFSVPDPSGIYDVSLTQL
jgi:hypothetical protein